MTRRELLKLLLSGAAGYSLDIDRLLWVPGAKKIFIPSERFSVSDIIAAELKRLEPKVRMLFERDDIFYQQIKNKLPVVSSRSIRVPLCFEDDE